jgi:hypothetical protein
MALPLAGWLDSKRGLILLEKQPVCALQNQPDEIESIGQTM